MDLVHSSAYLVHDGGPGRQDDERDGNEEQAHDTLEGSGYDPTQLTHGGHLHVYLSVAVYPTRNSRPLWTEEVCRFPTEGDHDVV